MSLNQRLQHGGNLFVAAKKYGKPINEWLDLSTGINPNGWEVPEIPTKHFKHLPDQARELIRAAKGYYQSESILATPGSQGAIQSLPRLRQKSKIALPKSGYAEHEFQWRINGHEIFYYDHAISDGILDFLVENEIDVLVVINPNNPTADMVTTRVLLDCRTYLAKTEGWLVVDEAFIDTRQDCSLAQYCPLPGLIVLRSIGKFFGLAGIRLGFVLAPENLLEKIESYIGPWAVSGVSEYVGTLALLDLQWHESTRLWLPERVAMLEENICDVFYKIGFHSYSKTDYFLTFTVKSSMADYIVDGLARQAIWIRKISIDDKAAYLRFGLTAQSESLIRLKRALSALAENASLSTSK